MPSKGTIPRTCERCGAAFTTWPFKVRMGKGRFCSHACSVPPRLSDRTHYIGVGACLICGGPTRVRNDRVVRFCSTKCAAINRAQTKTRTIADRFWPRVVKTDTCWLSTGGHHDFGYGMMQAVPLTGNKLPTTMSRVAWWLATGYWPTSAEYVCHDCPDGDNAACVRNDIVGTHLVDGIFYEKRGHLWLGNAAANMADKIAKGRQRNGPAGKLC